MANKSTESFARCYRHAWRSDPDFQQFADTKGKDHVYIELMLHDCAGASGIHVINPDILAAEIKEPAGYIKMVLDIPNELFIFNNVKNVIWLKKFFYYRQKIPGVPGTFIRCIVQDYQATKYCENFWRGFFETNQEVLNKFYLEKFYDDFLILRKELQGEPLKEGEKKLTKTRKQGLKAIEELFHIKQKLFGEPPTGFPNFTFSIDMVTKFMKKS